MAETATRTDDYRYQHVTFDVLQHDLKFQAGPAPGDAMPSLDLLSTDRTRMNTTQWVGDKPVLLIFGSVSCPMTATSIRPLTRLYDRFGENVTFILLNVREAHPGEDVPQPESLDQKLEHAATLKDRYRIPWTVATDDVEGTVHQALDPKPNAAYLIDRNGRIAFRALWAADERGLRQALESVARGETPAERESQRRLVPMTMGMGEMRHMLEESGPRAKRDLWRAAPPMAAMAWMASWFKPLSPLQRGFAAMGVVMTLVAVVIIALVAWIA